MNIETVHDCVYMYMSQELSRQPKCHSYLCICRLAFQMVYLCLAYFIYIYLSGTAVYHYTTNTELYPDLNP